MHDPGKIIADLAVAVAVDGGFLADIAMLRSQPELTGRSPQTWWCPGWSPPWPRIRRRALRTIRVARDAAWERTWRLAGDATPGTGGGLVTGDLDATLVTAFSEAVRGSHAARPPGRP